MKKIKKLIMFLVLAVLVSCDMNRMYQDTGPYLDYLSDKAILSIKVFNDTLWVASSKFCDTCEIPLWMSSRPTIEQLTVIADTVYTYEEPAVFGTPVADGQGNLYVSDGSSLYKVNSPGDYTPEYEFADFQFNCMAFDKNDNLWLSGYNGLAYMDTSGVEYFGKDNSSLPVNITHALAIDQSGTVWVALDFDGLLKIENGNWVYIASSEIPGCSELSYLNEIVVDRDNNVWFNIFNPGIDTDVLMYNASGWNYEEGIYGDLTVDSEGKVWRIDDIYENNTFVRTDLFYYNEGEWEPVDVSDIDRNILCLNVNDGILYLGTVKGLVLKVL